MHLRISSAPAIKLCMRTAVAILVLPVPLTLLWLAVHDPGINLASALSDRVSGQAVANVLVGDGIAESRFRQGLIRSILYSTGSAVISAAVASGFVLFVVDWRAERAYSLAFVLLGLVLLPQTFSVLAILWTCKTLGLATANPVLILLALSATNVPIACWSAYLILGEDVRKTLFLLAADGIPTGPSILMIAREYRIPLLQIFLLTFALAFGNFVLPFALGDNKTYPALVAVVGFSSNLGRDWASVAAAGLIMVAPVIAISMMLGWTLSGRLLSD